MADGLLNSITPFVSRHNIRLFGQINAPQSVQPTASRKNAVEIRRVRPPGLNLPTNEAVQATREMKHLVGRLGDQDLCIALISGGGSSLLCDPVSDITLQQKVTAIRLLADNGADIRQLNTVRQCLSNIKAGGLARCCNAEFSIALVLSDVIGDALEMIASGPMFECKKPFALALSILDRFDTDRRVPEAIRNYLVRSGQSPHRLLPPTSQTTEHVVIGNTLTAVEAAKRCAGKLGYHVISQVAFPPETVDSKAKELVDSIRQSKRKTCVISGGEPTLKLVSESIRGKGGRNQQLVLTALCYAMQIPELTDRPFCWLSAGTDGEDGNTCYSGAWCDNQTIGKLQRTGADITHYLDNNDAGSLLQQTGSLIDAAPTHTNVCDLRVFICEQASAKKSSLES